MRLMSTEQEQMLKKLVELAEGDVRLVEEAMASAPADADGAPDMEHVIEHILTHLPRIAAHA